MRPPSPPPTNLNRAAEMFFETMDTTANPTPPAPTTQRTTRTTGEPLEVDVDREELGSSLLRARTGFVTDPTPRNARTYSSAKELYRQLYGTEALHILLMEQVR